jgi:hypothetical protein
VGATRGLREPPVAIAEQLHRGGDEHRPDDRGVDEHRERKPESDELQDPEVGGTKLPNIVMTAAAAVMRRAVLASPYF